MKVKVGDYVLINKEAPVKGYGQTAKDGQYPLFVYQLYPDSTTISVYTNGLGVNNFAQNPFNIDSNFVKVLSEAELKKAIKFVNKDYGKAIKAKEAILKPKHVTIDKRVIENLISRNYLNTTLNYAIGYVKGVLKGNNNKTSVALRSLTWPSATCCAFSRTTLDIVVYIPKTWINYFGYNQVNLTSWLSFLSKCEVGFEGKILGTKTLKEVFATHVNDNFKLGAPSNNLYVNTNEDCYEVLINANSSVMATYLYFILVRFIYSSKYWNIPFIAMKLKKYMPKATHWECLLLAHSYENYDPYYSIIGNTEGNLALPSKYNSPSNIMSNLRSNSSMNNSLKRYECSSTEIRTAIRSLNYDALQEIINKYKNVN